MVHPAQELARRCIDDEAQALPSPLPVEPAALALALKDEAVAAWGTVPARALRCWPACASATAPRWWAPWPTGPPAWPR